MDDCPPQEEKSSSGGTTMTMGFTMIGFQWQWQYGCNRLICSVLIILENSKICIYDLDVNLKPF